MRAAEDRVLVQLDPKESRTAGGLYIPDAAQKNAVTGVVLSVGPKVRATLREGDRVLFGEYAGAIVEERRGETPVVAITEPEILAIVTG